MTIRWFKKLAVGATLFSLPAASFAMQSLNNSEMSSISGRDGVTLSMSVPDLAYDETIYDRDGITQGQLTDIGAGSNNLGLSPGKAGALVIKDMKLNMDCSNSCTPGLDMVADAGQSSSGDPVMNLKLITHDSTTISINPGDIFVGTATTTNDVGTAADWDVSNIPEDASNNDLAVISADSSQIELTDAVLNYQFGNVAQTMTVGSNTANPVATFSGKLLGGYIAEGVALNDTGTSNPGKLYIGKIKMLDSIDNGGQSYADGDDLTIGSAASPGLGMNVTNAGLAIGIHDLGGKYGVNEYISGLKLGDTSASAPGLGKLAVEGLDLSGTTVTIYGH